MALFISSHRSCDPNLRQKAWENQRRIMVLENFLHTALLYQVTTTRNINVVVVVLVERNNGLTSVQLVIVSARGPTPCEISYASAGNEF